MLWGDFINASPAPLPARGESLGTHSFVAHIQTVMARTESLETQPVFVQGLSSASLGAQCEMKWAETVFLMENPCHFAYFKGLCHGSAGACSSPSSRTELGLRSPQRDGHRNVRAVCGTLLARGQEGATHSSGS